MTAWLNLGSLVLGAIAWILPAINISSYDKRSWNWFTLTFVSISACSISLFFQICSFYVRVKTEDWSALSDTVSVIASVPAILLIGTIVLNAITLYIYRDRADSVSRCADGER
ncbi:hypothetical protein ACVNS2_16715 [Paenibacillus caseinilyticus]|uniref:hypothetical protein n=1 Tax=Paenibacillus mucilaginosus TaxID=61624 RepID=UPI0009DC1A4C|nr:hypothetical protein [Paenibacillus mucilaginosus]